MARCPPEIAEVRAWPDVVERKPGVFYVRRQPFLHFHLLEGVQRRADVRGRTAWISVDLPRPLPAAKRRELVRELRRRYRERDVSDRAGRRGPGTAR